MMILCVTVTTPASPRAREPPALRQAARRRAPGLRHTARVTASPPEPAVTTVTVTVTARV